MVCDASRSLESQDNALFHGSVWPGLNDWWVRCKSSGEAFQVGIALPVLTCNWT